MKKFNNKGFILVETVVVSAFVLIIFVLVFRNGVPMMEEYKKLENYDDIDSLYAVNLVKDIIKKDENYHTIVENISKGVKFIDLTDCSELADLNLCETVKLRANITKDDKIYLTHIDPSIIKSAINNGEITSDRRFTGYIDYLNDSYNEDAIVDPYMIIITRTLENYNPYLENEEEKFENVKTVKFGSIGFQ